MALYNNSLTHYYDYVFTDLADPRTNDWFLISSPMPGLTLLGAYLYFVLSAGPRYMRHRKPFELTNVLIFYNFVQVLISTWIFWEGLDGAWLRHYSWRCEPVDFSNNPDAIRVARGVYIYFLAKLTELLDTVFFVLRKKDRQITFLHMYHHTVMPMVSWGATKYYPGGHGTFIGVINSFVHIIMYFYYMMAAMGPQFQKYLWWKKYITTLQMECIFKYNCDYHPHDTRQKHYLHVNTGQFCLAFLHSFQLVFYDCGYPRWSVFLTLPNAIFFYYLFNDFYGKAYSSYNKNQSGEEKSISNGKVVEEKQDSHNKEKEA